jgi:hypothetical protein
MRMICRRSVSVLPPRSCRHFVCVRWLIRYVSHHDFIPFAWYRIAFGAIILATAYWGWVRWD